MACSHQSCACQVEGCGIAHPRGWKPKMTASINGVIVSGDDHADCMAHYLLHLGYPTDRPDHLRGIAESMVAKRATYGKTISERDRSNDNDSVRGLLRRGPRS